MPKRFSKQMVNAAIAELDKVRENWLRRPGVTGLDVGYKIKDGMITDDLAIRIHVENKKPPEMLEMVTFTSEQEEPGMLGNFSVDIIEATYTIAANGNGSSPVDRRDRVNPLVGGISVGNERISAGTLGAIVWDNTDGSANILSNWHVLCGSPDCRQGEPIWQPGKLDGGSAADTIATLERWILDPRADAALAKLNDQRQFLRDILELEPIRGIVKMPRLGQKVVKSGRTTGLTKGVIDGVSMSLRLAYAGNQQITFHDQLRIVPRSPWPAQPYELSKGGDSGSIWIAESTRKAVGLHFAGETDQSPASEYAVANPMHVVADLLNFSFKPMFNPATITPKPKNGKQTDLAQPTLHSGDEKKPPSPPRLRNALRRVVCRMMPFLCQPGAISFSPEEAASANIEQLLDELIKEINSPT